MKTLNTPYTMHENTVMESEFDEVQTKATRKRKPHCGKADHKHKYDIAYAEDHYKSPVSGKEFLWFAKINYCTICGRIDNAWWLSHEPDIPKGAKIFRSSPDRGNGYLAKFVDDLTDYYYKE